MKTRLLLLFIGFLSYLLLFETRSPDQLAGSLRYHLDPRTWADWLPLLLWLLAGWTIFVIYRKNGICAKVLLAFVLFAVWLLAGNKWDDLFGPFLLVHYWIFEPIESFLLRGTGDPLMSGVAWWRYCVLPIILLVMITLFLLHKRKKTDESSSQNSEQNSSEGLFSSSLFRESYLATFMAVWIVLGFGVILYKIGHWFLDGFYYQPFGLFISTGVISWKLSVLPVTLLVLSLTVYHFYRKRRVQE